jgi:hypothetical protein
MLETSLAIALTAANVQPLKISHRLCRADGLGSGGFVDGERIVAKPLLRCFRYFSFDGAAPVA